MVSIFCLDLPAYFMDNTASIFHRIFPHGDCLLTTQTTKMPQRGRRIGKEAWIEAARTALVYGGVEYVKVERLVKDLQATRRSFYWHFKNCDELLKALVDHWKKGSTEMYEAAINRESHDGALELEFINNLWVNDKDFDPAFDSAMREWGRMDKEIDRMVKAVDNKRIDVLHQIFVDYGYEEPEALIRARIAYFQQIGYYTLGVKEDPKTRHEYAPIYLKVLLGR
jgi:AcrR family transcriptional regulator